MKIKIKKVLIADDVSDKCADILTTAGIEVIQKLKLSKEELIAQLKVRMFNVMYEISAIIQRPLTS